MNILLLLLTSSIFFFSCSLKSKTVSYTQKTCDQMFEEVVSKKQKDFKNLKVYSHVYYRGKHILMKGKFNKYGGGTIKFYLPIGKKIATIKKEDETFCIEDQDGCKRIDNPFRKIGLSVEKVITKNFKVSKYDNYSCSNGSLLINKPGFSLVYKNGELKNVLIRNLLITYVSEKEIHVYDMGNMIAEFKIEKIIVER